MRRIQHGRSFGSLFCRCPDCGFGWLQNNCIRNGDERRHLLIKRGPVLGWHLSSRHRGSMEGMYVCPVCGSDPCPDMWASRPPRPLEPRDFAWTLLDPLATPIPAGDDDDLPF